MLITAWVCRILSGKGAKWRDKRRESDVFIPSSGPIEFADLAMRE
jgi:hypothetical protein